MASPRDNPVVRKRSMLRKSYIDDLLTLQSVEFWGCFADRL